MVNRNYQKGYMFEKRVMAYLEKRGFYCMRAGKSKGLFDIIAIPPIIKPEINRFTLLIQCKSNGYVPPKELNTLKDNDKYQGWPLIAYNEKHKLKFRTLDNKGVLIT